MTDITNITTIIGFNTTLTDIDTITVAEPYQLNIGYYSIIFAIITVSILLRNKSNKSNKYQ